MLFLCYFLLFWASGFFGAAEGWYYFVLLSAILGSSATPCFVLFCFVVLLRLNLFGAEEMQNSAGVVRATLV